MKNKIRIGFTAGFLGAIILIIVMFVFKWIGIAGDPSFVGIYHHTFGVHSAGIDIPISAFLFAVSGGIWGAIFTSLFKQKVVKGMVFGIAPSLWVWLVIAPYMGHPLFNGFALKGLLFPLIFNCVIWGGFIGWYTRKKLRR